MAAYKIADFRRRLFPEGFTRTKRLLLTPLQASDAFQLVVLTNDPLVATGVSLLRQPFTLTDAQELIGLAHVHRGCFASVRLGDNGPFIGCAGALVRNETEIEIGFWIGVPCHGRKYGAEAASAVLGLLRDGFPEYRIVAECPRENSASWRLLRRLGFSPGDGKSARKGSRVLSFIADEAVGWTGQEIGTGNAPTLAEASGAADQS
jgi:RimJ/RimL family protein N-acetyltransferase